jgi:hypothetical protein
LLSAGEVAVLVTGYPMNPTPPHLEALEEVERAGIPGLLEMLSEEGIDGVRYALWDATGVGRRSRRTRTRADATNPAHR